MGINDGFVAELKHEAATTRKLLERVPQDSLTWKPHDKSMSLARLAGHVAELPGLINAVLAMDELDFGAGQFKPFEPTSVNDLLEKFDQNIAGAMAALNAQTDENMFKPWRMRNGEQIFFEMPRIAVMRTMGINHFIHHRGQLSVYLRLLNVPLPAMYGPSADENKF